jgi:hypothetical protein
VCADTVARIENLAWTLEIRETLQDVDEPADLNTVIPAKAGIQSPSPPAPAPSGLDSRFRGNDGEAAARR